MKQYFKPFVFLILVNLFASCKDQPIRKNSSSTPIDPEIEKIITSMSVEEKVGQMTQITVDLILGDDETEVIDEEKLRYALVEKNIGSIINVKWHAYSLDTWQHVLKRVQEVATNDTNHKVPVLYGIDAIHGMNYTQGATLFPHNIGMAAARNTDLITKSAKITALETRASGVRWNFDPVLGLGRQPLWSRFEETFGEDTYLVGELGAAAIRSYEGDGLDKTTAVASCMKHFVGYSVPRTGKDRTPSYIPEIELKEYFLPPFQKAVDAGTASVMINSGEVNGKPVHGSKLFLTQILREEMGFEGVIVTDWEDIIRLKTRDRIAATDKEAVRIGVEAGIDMSMVPYDYTFYDLLVELVKEGTISEERIDASVRRILTMKKKVGLMDNPFIEKEAIANFGKEEYKVTAKEAALETLTLLKNGNDILPLDKSKKVLLAGPSANNKSSLHGSWSFVWQGTDESRYPESTLTIKQALQNKIGAQNVISSSISDYNSNVNFDTQKLIREARGVDYIVLCLGEGPYAESPGVIDDLTLDANQLALANAAIKTGKPVILVLVEGRPRVISSIESEIDGILMAYRPASQGANAIADVLFGDYNPNGKLPFTYPRYTGDVLTYDHKFSETIRESGEGQNIVSGYNPQWDFGTGLSYTEYTYGEIQLSSDTLTNDTGITASVSVTNSGSTDGLISVELYSRDLYASITPSVRRLRKFTKIALKSGESAQVTFDLNASDLAFVGESGEWINESGEFHIMIGDKSASLNYK